MSRMAFTRERDTDVKDAVYKGEGYRYIGCCLQGRGIQISRMLSTRERDTDV